MDVPSADDPQAARGDTPMILFRLYIAGDAANSLRAIANLKTICRKYLQDHCGVEMVDILQEPLRALSEGVLVTPTLLRLSPLPVRTIVGDLGETATVLEALGLEG